MTTGDCCRLTAAHTVKTGSLVAYRSLTNCLNVRLVAKTTARAKNQGMPRFVGPFDPTNPRPHDAAAVFLGVALGRYSECVCMGSIMCWPVAFSNPS